MRLYVLRYFFSRREVSVATGPSVGRFGLDAVDWCLGGLTHRVMASKSKTKNVGGFKFSEARRSADAPAAPRPPPESTTRLSGTKRRGGEAAGAGASDDAPRDVGFIFDALATSSAVPSVVAVDAVRSYMAAILHHGSGQPAYFARAAEAVSLAFEQAASAVGGTSRRKSTSKVVPGFRNPKNIANAQRVAAIKEHLAGCVL
jgi:hypothetical protein